MLGTIEMVPALRLKVEVRASAFGLHKAEAGNCIGPHREARHVGRGDISGCRVDVDISAPANNRVIREHERFRQQAEENSFACAEAKELSSISQSIGI